MLGMHSVFACRPLVQRCCQRLHRNAAGIPDVDHIACPLHCSKAPSAGGTCFCFCSALHLTRSSTRGPGRLWLYPVCRVDRVCVSCAGFWSSDAARGRPSLHGGHGASPTMRPPLCPLPVLQKGADWRRTCSVLFADSTDEDFDTRNLSCARLSCNRVCVCVCVWAAMWAGPPPPLAPLLRRWAMGWVALEGERPQRRPQRRLNRRLEEGRSQRRLEAVAVGD